jgi:hypothetical protein
MKRLLALLLAVLLAACASGPPVGIVGSPSGSGGASLGQQLRLSANREPAEAPRTVFIGMALDGTEGVFDRDVALLDRLFAREFGAGYRSLRFSNAVLLQGDRELPLALPPTLKQTSEFLARTHREGDRYILLLTSHGHKGYLALKQPALRRETMGWSAAQIAEALQALPATAPQWLIVSACYSGSLIPALTQAQRLVMTAASSERPSFGCGDKSPNTWFVKELHDALAAGGDWERVWQATQAQVLAREQALKFQPSVPQRAVGASWAPKLERRWQEF